MEIAPGPIWHIHENLVTNRLAISTTGDQAQLGPVV
jgi:hypothetical protein